VAEAPSRLTVSVSTDILAMWRRPRTVVARQLAQGVREERALAILLAGCLLVFIGRLPILQRGVVLAGEEGNFLRDVSYSFLGLMILAPILFYGLAALGRLIALAFGLRASGHGARLALFWAYLSAAPAALLYGLVLGLAGPGPGAQITGAVWLVAFLIFWTTGLRVAGGGEQHA